MCKNRNLSVNGFLERDQGFGPHYSGNDLDFVGKYVAKVFVVAGINFYEKGVVTRSIMAFNDFRYPFEFLDYIAVVAGMLKENAYVCTGPEPDKCRINLKLRTTDHPCLNKPLNALVNRST